MNKQQLHELPEKFSLHFSAYCGMREDLLDHASYAQCRDEVAKILRRKRRDPETDWQISIAEPNLGWETIYDGYYSGVYWIAPPKIKGRCDQCGEYICTDDKYYLPVEGDDSYLCCSRHCHEEYNLYHTSCDHCGEWVEDDPHFSAHPDGIYCSEQCQDKAEEEREDDD